jgi:protein gp37
LANDRVISIRKQCRKYGIPFFFKQWGGVHKAAAGRKLDGRTYDEMPSPVAAGTACFKGTKLGAFAAG